MSVDYLEGFEDGVKQARAEMTVIVAFASVVVFALWWLFA